jgi:anti-sigma factor RsiW
VLAGCAAGVFAWMLGTTVLAWRANEDFAIAAVATHVRATLGDHLIEVASSDRHTVKPWLSARLDYAPPVQDLASEGFTLIGGRLDYLERHNVATLVYRYGEHTIDVFVRPNTSRVRASALRSVRGFNVARASGASMDWLAVSDADPAVLSVFVQRLAREDVSR